MTAEKYFNLCEQMEIEPEERKIPPEQGDFPLDVQKAMDIFNKLGDRIVVDIGYLGKDYGPIDTFMNVYGISDKRICLETLLRLDAKVIQKSAEAMKRERDRINAKNRS